MTHAVRRSMSSKRAIRSLRSQSAFLPLHGKTFKKRTGLKTLTAFSPSRNFGSPLVGEKLPRQARRNPKHLSRKLPKNYAKKKHRLITGVKSAQILALTALRSNRSTGLGIPRKWIDCSGGQ